MKCEVIGAISGSLEVLENQRSECGQSGQWLEVWIRTCRLVGEASGGTAGTQLASSAVAVRGFEIRWDYSGMQ